MSIDDCDSCGEPANSDTELVMSLGVKVMQATAALDVHANASVRALTDVEVLWAHAMRQWMEKRGIPLAEADYQDFLANTEVTS